MNGESTRYWIWLQLCLGQGAYFTTIIEEFGSIENLYKANILDWKMNTALTSKQVEALAKYSLDDADKIIDDCKKTDCRIITYDSEEFPEPLRMISNPPAVIYVDGQLCNFERYAVIGIVGTRKASSYSLKAAQIMAKGMSACGAVIVSGGALGVDSAAHRGAIDAHGKTYAVLGNGFGADYLKANEKLRNEIKSSGGALISEYPPYTQPSKYTFPMRNRLISALSDGVLVVEAGVKSGSLITAGHAAEQGRDIFAIPASIFDKNFQGTNKLIDDGATVATSPYTVLSRYSEKYSTLDLSKAMTPYELATAKNVDANAEEKKQISFDSVMKDRAERVRIQSEAVKLDGEEKTVYELLDSESFIGIEDIIKGSNIAPQKVLAALTMLEMKGVIESASGKRYRIK